MNQPLRRLLAVIVAIPLLCCLLWLAHYQIWLRSFKATVVTVHPGKWVWVECQTRSFNARIDGLGLTGIAVTADVDLPGMPCSAVGITSLGGGRYFMPFRTVLKVTDATRISWSNPFSI